MFDAKGRHWMTFKQSSFKSFAEINSQLFYFYPILIQNKACSLVLDLGNLHKLRLQGLLGFDSVDALCDGREDIRFEHIRGVVGD